MKEVSSRENNIKSSFQLGWVILCFLFPFLCDAQISMGSNSKSNINLPVIKVGANSVEERVEDFMNMFGEENLSQLPASYQFTFQLHYQLDMDGYGHPMTLYYQPDQNYYGLFIDYGDYDYILIIDPDRDLSFLFLDGETKTAISLDKDDPLFLDFWKSIPGNNPESEGYSLTHLKYRNIGKDFCKGQLIESPEGITEVWLTMKAPFPYNGGIPEVANIPKVSWTTNYQNLIQELTYTPKSGGGLPMSLSLVKISESPFELVTSGYKPLLELFTPQDQ